MKRLQDIKIFESLNCNLCKESFVPIARQLRSPRGLVCGLTVCHECLEKEEGLRFEERKHQCEYRLNCFGNPNFAYFIIDVLSQDCFNLQPNLGGYLLKEPLINPVCPICLDEYSNKVDSKKASVFFCNHIVCTECFDKMLEPNNDVRTQATYSYKAACPTCKTVTLTNRTNHWKYWLHDFLNELPEMTRQFEEMDKSKFRFCEGCDELDDANKMFYCDKCKLKLCGTCTYKKHRTHKAIELLHKEADQMSEELYNQTSQSSEIFQKQLSDNIQTFMRKLATKAEILKEASSFDDLRKKHGKCLKRKLEFESLSEQYMPRLREYDTKIQELTLALDKD